MVYRDLDEKIEQAKRELAGFSEQMNVPESDFRLSEGTEATKENCDREAKNFYEALAREANLSGTTIHFKVGEDDVAIVPKSSATAQQVASGEQGQNSFPQENGKPISRKHAEDRISQRMMFRAERALRDGQRTIENGLRTMSRAAKEAGRDGVGEFGR